jgi:hypothetical protein
MSNEADKKNTEQPQFPTLKPYIPSMDVNAVYANGSNIAATSTEVQLTFVLNARPAVMVVMPFALAKSMLLGLANAIKDHEKTTGTAILSLDELRRLKP